MKKSSVIRIVIWSFVAFVLLLLLMFFLFGSFFENKLGIKQDNFFDNIKTMGYSYMDEDSYEVGSGEVMAEDVDSVLVNWVSGDISIKKYEGKTIKIEDSVKDDEDAMLRYRVNNNKLTIQFCKSKLSNLWNNDSSNKKVTIYIPDGMKFSDEVEIDSVSAEIDLSSFESKELSVDSVSGDVSINDVISDDISVDTVSGSVNLNNVKAPDCSFDSVSGDFSIDGDFRDVDFESVSGDLKVKSVNKLERLDKDTVSGDITIVEDIGVKR